MLVLFLRIQDFVTVLGSSIRIDLTSEPPCSLEGQLTSKRVGEMGRRLNRRAYSLAPRTWKRK